MFCSILFISVEANLCTSLQFRRFSSTIILHYFLKPNKLHNKKQTVHRTNEHERETSDLEILGKHVYFALIDVAISLAWKITTIPFYIWQISSRVCLWLNISFPENQVIPSQIKLLSVAYTTRNDINLFKSIGRLSELNGCSELRIEISAFWSAISG